ncbi:MAG: amino acid permease [Myxococcota bacterium]
MKTLERRLGLLSVLGISMGAMLGSGLFVLPGLASALTGPSIWLAYLGAGLMVLPAALSKAELATAMPVAGGTYVYIDRTFGPLAGTIAGLGLWLSLLLKSAFALVGFGAYLRAIATDYLQIPIPLRAMALLLLGLVALLNAVGVRKVGRVQSWIVAASVLGMLTLALLAMPSFNPALLHDSFPRGANGFIGAVAFVYISYAGVTKVAAVAEEVRDPGRNLPLGMLISLTVVGVLYAVVTLVLVGHLPMQTLAGDLRPIYTLALSVGGSKLALLAAILAVLTMTSMANSGLLAASRFPFAMARDRLLPSGLCVVHDRFLTPVRSILLTVGIMAVAILALDVEKIAKLAGSFMIAAFSAVSLTVIVLRESDVPWYRPSYRSPLYPWMQLLGVLGGIVLLWMMGVLGAVALLAMTASGAVLYLAYGRHRTSRRGVFGQRGPRRELVAQPPPLPYLDAALPGQAQVVVALLGEERSPETLVEVGASLSDGRRVEVLHLTDAPEQMELDMMLEDDVGLTSIRRRISAMAQVRRFDLDLQAVVTRDVVKTIYEVTNQVHCDWLVMDWAGIRPRGITPFNPLGWLVNHLSANLALLRDAGVRYTREILALPKPGPHDALVVDTAEHLAGVFGARVTLVGYVPDDADPIRLQATADYLEQLGQLCGCPVGHRILRGKSEVSSVVDATSAFDLLVLGAPASARLRFPAAPEDAILQSAACSVLRVRAPRAHQKEARSVGARSGIRLIDFVDDALLATRIEVQTKAELFSRIAKRMAQVLDASEVDALEEALWERERSQNTSVGHGVALPHATLPAARRDYLGVFSLGTPVDYDASDGGAVDVLFVTVGPPSERNTHLKILADVARLVLSSDIIDELRQATHSEQIRDTLARHGSV